LFKSLAYSTFFVGNCLLYIFVVGFLLREDMVLLRANDLTSIFFRLIGYKIVISSKNGNAIQIIDKTVF